VATKDELLKTIKESGVLSPESEEELKASIIACKEKFLGKTED
jgi:hypothetical protein